MKREISSEDIVGDIVFEHWVNILKNSHPSIIVNPCDVRPVNLALFFTNSAKKELLVFEGIMDLLYEQVLMKGMKDWQSASVLAIIDYREKNFYVPYGWIFLNGFSDFNLKQGKSTFLSFASNFLDFLNQAIRDKTVH